MGLELRQNLKLSQQLVMTPQLQQAIKLLQLSRPELLEAIQQELLENPVLEEAMEYPAGDAGEGRETEQAPAEIATAAMSCNQRDLLRNADWETYLGDFSSTSKQHSKETEIQEEMTPLEGRIAGKPTLEGHLLWQLRLSDMEEWEQAIGEAIIGNLDARGYLAATVDEIAALTDASPAQVESVLARIQRMDPVGVAARSLQECLLVQLEMLRQDDPILIALVRHHLEDIERKRFKPLARKFKIELEDLGAYLEIIKRLDPLPGASFGSEATVYISPDVFVHEYNGEFVVVLNEEGLPRLQLNPQYESLLQDGSNGPERDYIQDKARSAQWIIKSLHQRQKTLYKVTESIVRFQKEFFRHGVTHLRPLVLKDVAEDIGMHESTVSRITSNKYVATPHGVFELKFFFNSGLSLDDGSEVGSESVKAIIKQLVSEEDPAHPLSDDKIAKLLKKRLDINIARRTVAKYRTVLGIESSSRRRRVL